MSLSSEIKTINAAEKGLHIMTDDEVRKLTGILLEMCVFLQNVSQEMNIQWGLCGGSALGAIRHKGFIPWDDDIDICMTRQNFAKLKDYFENHDTGKYKLQIPGDTGYYCHYPRIVDTSKSLITLRTIGEGFVFLDIYLIEDTYDNRIKRYAHGIECTYYLFVISCLLTHISKENLIKYGTPKLIRQVKLRDLFSILFRSKRIEEWIADAYKVFSKANNPDSQFVCIPSGAKHYFGEIYSREDICEYKFVPFENKQLPVPVNTDHYLKTRYGNDYMMIPDEKHKERHVIVSCSL